MSHERTCVVCGNEYQYCKRCRQFEHLPTWMFAYCSEPCKETYMVINKYEYGHIDATSALEELNTYKVKIANKEMLKTVTNIKKESSKAKKNAQKEAEATAKAETTTPVES
jgi:hypothetical protein